MSTQTLTQLMQQLKAFYDLLPPEPDNPTRAEYARAHAYALYISLHTRSSNVYNADGSLVEDQSFSAFEALISSINMVYSTAPITVNIV
jgi:hypothetical protein